MRKHLRMISAVLLLLLSCTLAPAAYADSVPATAAAFLADRIAQGYEITAWKSNPLCTHAYAVLSKDGENKLMVLKQSGDTYQIEVVSNKALYQGDLLPQFAFYNDDAFYIIYFLGPVASELYFYRQANDGIWRLQKYRLCLEDGVRREFSTLYDDRMVYRYYPPTADNSHPSMVRNVYGVYQRALRYLNIHTLPRTLEEARETLSLPPGIPAGDFDAVNVKFRSGEKFEVYAAPDDTSLRAANGKAVVSTNDWIQVFGTENGWALIQYDISSSKMRIGYITQTALPNGTSVSGLAFIPMEIEILRDTPVTDDPLSLREPLTMLREGQPDCWYLATLNEDYAYIQAVTEDGQLYRGFVAADAVHIVLPEDEK